MAVLVQSPGALPQADLNKAPLALNRYEEIRHWRKTALIGPPKCVVADPYLFEKIPRPTPLRFRLGDHCLAFLSDEHFRAFEPISLRQSDRVRPTSDQEFGCVHVDTVPMPVTVQVVPRSTNKEQCPLITTCEESRWNLLVSPLSSTVRSRRRVGRRFGVR